MSEEGKSWLIAAIDPFHDKPLRITGYPDGVPGKSIVQCLRLAYDISKPVGLTAGSTWDAMISTSNFAATASALKNGKMKPWSNIVQAHTLLGTAKVGGCVITTGQTGADLSQNLLSQPLVTSNQLTVPTQVLEGKLRVLSQGFEISNTTPELYKNGSVTVFEQAQEIPEDKFTVVYNTTSWPSDPTIATNAGATSAVNSTRLPSTIAEAVQLPGSATWEAKDGAYLVCRQNNMLNPPRRPSNVMPLIPLYDSGYTFPSTTADVMYYDNSPGGTAWGSACSQPIPYHTKGCYFTNLHENTTLHVAYNVWVERFPSTQQADLLSLASESADFDPEALEAYAFISSQMPVGARFDENGLGDWFTGVVASLIDKFTGTTIASELDKWQKGYSNSGVPQVAQAKIIKPLPSKPLPKPPNKKKEVTNQKKDVKKTS